MKIWDTRYAKLCDYLVKKKRCYMQRFHKARLYHDMCPNKQPEHIQNLKCFNEQLRELIDSEKERAKHQPEQFEPIKPALSPFHQSSSIATVRTSIKDSQQIENEMIDSSEDCKPDATKLAYYGYKEPYTEDSSGSQKEEYPCASLTTSPCASIVTSPHTSIVTSPHASIFTSPYTSIVTSPYASKITSPHTSVVATPPRQKRKLHESGSSGTLKLVLKRRTTDNFMVKKSPADMYEDLKSDVHLAKSESESESDSQIADAARTYPLIIRRRTLSMSSRQTSSSDISSCSSPANKTQDHSSVGENSDEEIDENNDEDDESSDEGEEIEKSSIDDKEIVEQFIGSKECSSKKYCVSGRDDLQNNQLGNVASCKLSSDVFMENDEILDSVEALNHYNITIDQFSAGRVVRPSKDSGASLDSPHSGKNSSASVTSEDVFHSNLSSYPHVDSPHAKDHLSYSVYSDGNRTGHSTVSLQTSVAGVPGLFGQSCRTSPCSRDEEYMSESSLSGIQKETSTKGPLSSSLFITPNKNLLKTDAMFNSDDDDDDADDQLSGDRRIGSAFKIDNKDPQSNMINDSVRSAINSVLDGDDDDDDDDDDEDDIDNKDLQNNWASSANRLPVSSSSSSIHNLFHSSLSSSRAHSHDADLDAAVQSILNS
ncbi:unnamed protein product [Candidula unifasciata]|uniref:Uncharacterized protein n=1 Tax=Candidula unifasciata TaxID=100452 RepID=A0A8S3Z7E4_9EUPU|nr:unnamed protein product [Candidula unifasciata]